MKELAAVSVIPKGILDFLEEAKKDRDYLAHKFFRNNDLKFMTWQGRRIMLSECDEIVNKLSRIDGVIEDLVEEQCKKFGIDKELIDREFSKLLSEI